MVKILQAEKVPPGGFRGYKPSALAVLPAGFISLFLFAFFTISCNVRKSDDRNILTGQEIPADTWRITLEAAEDMLIKELSGYNQDSVFNQALNDARTNRQTVQKDFVDLFYEAIQKRKPEVRLADYFASFHNQLSISSGSSNDEVIAYLYKEKNIAYDRTSEILKERIIKSGVRKPVIQIDRSGGRIIVELPDAYDTVRVRRLLESSGKLEFYETYSLTEMAEFLTEADKILATDSDVTPNQT